MISVEGFGEKQGVALLECRAMRIGGMEASADVDDIRHLAAELGVTTAQAALDLLARFYPAQLIEAQVRFGLEEIFDVTSPGGAA
jgi:hypothetical protein